MARDRTVNARRTLALTVGVAAMGLWALGGCARSEPPAPVQDPTYAPLPGAPGSTGAPAPRAETSSAGNSGPAASTQVASPGASAAQGTAPQQDPGTLPQTKDRPAPTSPALTARARALFDAIAQDSPEAAMPFFFPVSAYEQVKAIADPAGDWKRRLVAAYVRDIHAAHKRLGDRASKATFVGLEVPDEAARWIKPGEEGNKLGYFRVYNTRIKYTIEGEAGFIDLKSLISWRGEWYIVHLAGFK